MEEICLTTSSEVERGYLERWCQRHSVPHEIVVERSDRWTVKLPLGPPDPRYSLLLKWLVAVPGGWVLEPSCDHLTD